MDTELFFALLVFIGLAVGVGILWRKKNAGKPKRKPTQPPTADSQK